MEVSSRALAASPSSTLHSGAGLRSLTIKKAKASVCSGNDTPDAEDNDIESLVSLGSFGQGCNTEQNSAWDKIHE